MKNVIFFVILALFTVAALVGWNALRNKIPSVTQKKATPTTPTPEVGSSMRGDRFGIVGGIPYPTISGEVTTKGGQPIVTVLPTPTTKPGQPQPTSKPEPTSAPQATNVVLYQDNGFSPKTITVKSGTMVTFKNVSNSKRMWVIGDGGLNMEVSVGKNGTYEYQFNQTGTYNFRNNENSSDTGTVVVQ